MARDDWSGFGRKAVRRAGESFDVGIGRGWMVVHEVLHSIGLGQSDEEGSVMSPVTRITNVLGRDAARGEQRATHVEAMAMGTDMTGCPQVPSLA